MVSRKTRMRQGRAKSMARLLAEEHGSVDGFMDEHNIGIEPGSVQEEIYRQLRRGEIAYLEDIEGRLK